MPRVNRKQAATAAALLAGAVVTVRAARGSVGPVYALEAGLAQLYALREGLDVAARQSGQVTR